MFKEWIKNAKWKVLVPTNFPFLNFFNDFLIEDGAQILENLEKALFGATFRNGRPNGRPKLRFCH